MNAIIFSAIWGIIMMYTGVVARSKGISRNMAILGSVGLVAVTWLEYAGMPFFNIPMKGMMAFTAFSLVMQLVLFVSTLFFFLLSGKDVEEVGHYGADYFALIFFVLSGAAIVTGFTSLLMLFLGIEILSIPLYVLAASDKRNLKSNEAGLKYFLMGSFSTGLMLMGIALIYGSTGTFFTDGIRIGSVPPSTLMMLGMVLMLISMAFKVSAAPFHFWTPDVYDGSPAVFTSFMATIVKAAAFVGFLRLFEGSFGKMHADWQLLVALVTAATLLIGNLTAVFQQSVKRMLAYSSIAQAGFMLFAVFALNNAGKQGLVLYAAAYSLATIGIFAVLLRMKDYTFEGFNGLARKQPLVAALVAVFLLSLAGIPLTAGFFAKYYMLVAALKTGQMFWLVIIAIIGAAVSVYYYFRVIQAMYFREGQAQTLEMSEGFKTTLLVTALLVVLLGVHPDWLLNLLN
jgi:NADH-quinone oxidoreductase subunit N